MPKNPIDKATNAIRAKGKPRTSAQRAAKPKRFTKYQTPEQAKRHRH